MVNCIDPQRASVKTIKLLLMIPEIIVPLIDGGKFLKACCQATLDAAHVRLIDFKLSSARSRSNARVYKQQWLFMSGYKA